MKHNDKAFTERLDKTLHKMAQHYEAVALVRTPPNKTDFKTAHSEILALVADEIIGEDLPVNQPFDDDFDDVERTAWRIFRKGANWMKDTQRKKLGI